MEYYLREFYRDGKERIVFQQPFKQRKRAQDAAERLLLNELVSSVETFTFKEGGEEVTLSHLMRG